MSESQKRIINFHIARLQDKSRDVRLKAIAELALLPDPEVLEALQGVFKTDGDLEVRKAAQEAGRNVFIKLKEQNAPGGSAGI
ncbi:MAG: HEAT repeat domain-containing protein [Anaerolineae bacterium]|nr:HEAT repeat domain-containing protein [Anaerolineae bacterium]